MTLKLGKGRMDCVIVELRAKVGETADNRNWGKDGMASVWKFVTHPSPNLARQVSRGTCDFRKMKPNNVSYKT